MMIVIYISLFVFGLIFGMVISLFYAKHLLKRIINDFECSDSGTFKHCFDRYKGEAESIITQCSECEISWEEGKNQLAALEEEYSSCFPKLQRTYFGRFGIPKLTVARD